MLALLLAMSGGLAHYSQSKYFPAAHPKLRGKIPGWSGAMLLISSIGVSMYRYGTGMGLFMASVIIPTAYCLLVFVLNLPRAYMVVTLSALLIFLFIDILL